MNPYFFIFELGAIFLFLMIFFHERKNQDIREVLLLSFAYGIILEALNIYMSKQFYVYNSGFALEILGVPLAIGAGWAVAYYLSSEIVGRFDFVWWQSPFLMALVAFLYDLSMDVIAIRAGFWSWQIALDEQWFGVPYGNFFGWLAVVWTFALFINLSRQDFIKPGFQKMIRFAAPFTSALLLGMQIMIFTDLSAALSGASSLGGTIKLFAKQDYSYANMPGVQAMQGYVLLAIILIFSYLFFKGVRDKKFVGKINKFVLFCSISIHLFFLFMLFTMDIYRDLPVLFLASIVALALDLFFETYPLGSFEKNEY
ncbi:MAG: carotenoid biosynthesis protein [Candidatus Pacebacteria bacterium]|nr:carotenoid biosynthesis protein [Candidatus Paceibacterota bacterium]